MHLLTAGAHNSVGTHGYFPGEDRTMREKKYRQNSQQNFTLEEGLVFYEETIMISKEKEVKVDFIRKIIAEDIRTNKYGGRVHTRFPPEPNGCLHIGNAMALCLNFEAAEEFKGKYNLRFDDTNPVKEEVEYIDAIKRDIKWLGFDWEEREYYASDYFDRLYEYAIQLTKKKKAYVCDLSQEEIREYRGTLTSPGKSSAGSLKRVTWQDGMIRVCRHWPE